MKTQHNKKKNFFTKKTILLIVVVLTILLGVGLFAKFDVDLSASVLNLSQITRNKKASFSIVPKEVLPTICIDSDGGIDYTTKGTIFLSGGINRMEEDSCNTNGTLREWFCGQPGDAAGLLRSENYVNCEFGCSEGVCNLEPTTGNISIKNLAIENGYFIASNDHQATFSITVKNIGNVSLPIAGIGNHLYLDGVSTVLTDNYSLDFLTTPSLSSLQPNDTYNITADITLDEDLTFSYYDTLHVDISTYPETDDNIVNNATILYITGEIVDCSTPENILNCSLGLSDCPVGCSGYSNTGIGDAIIENIYFTPNTNPFMGSNNDDNQINIVIKNIGNGPIVVPQELGTKKFLLGCEYIGGNGGFRTAIIPESIINPGENITTTVDVGFTDDIYNRYTSIGNKYLKCTLTSQQEQGRSNTDPNNIQMIYESDGTNNSFVLNYEVINSTGSETIIP